MNSKRSKKTVQIEDSRPVLLDKKEWLFRREQVPDSEIGSCVTWEYMREVRHQDCESTLEGYARSLLFGYRSMPKRRKFSDIFEGSPLRVLAYLADNAAMLEKPWQKLGLRLRAELSKPFKIGWGPLIELEFQSDKYGEWRLSLPEFLRQLSPTEWQGPRKEAKAILVAYGAKNWMNYRVRAKKPASIKEKEFPERNNEISFWLGMALGHSFIVPFPFLVNWVDCTPKEIVKAFEDWVERNHPKWARLDRGRGGLVSRYRYDVRDLGAMRILREMTERQFAEYKAEHDLFYAPLDQRKRKENSSPEPLDKLRKRAVAFFQTHFSCSKNQMPGSHRPGRNQRSS
jgi:hypothetical protein